MPAYCVEYDHSEKKVLACLHFFKPITISVGGAKLRMWRRCLLKIVTSEIVLVERLHAGSQALSLQWIIQEKITKLAGLTWCMTTHTQTYLYNVVLIGGSGLATPYYHLTVGQEGP